MVVLVLAAMIFTPQAPASLAPDAPLKNKSWAEARIRPRVREYAVTFTAYNAVPNQTDSDPSTSACGPTLPNQVAVSPDLSRALPCGSAVWVTLPDGRRYRSVVNDATNARYTRRVDLLMASYNDAMRFGVRAGSVAVHD